MSHFLNTSRDGDAFIFLGSCSSAQPPLLRINTQPELPEHNLKSLPLVLSGFLGKEAKISSPYNLLSEVAQGYLYPAVYNEAQVCPHRPSSRASMPRYFLHNTSRKSQSSEPQDCNIVRTQSAVQLLNYPSHTETELVITNLS